MRLKTQKLILLFETLECITKTIELKQIEHL